MTRLTISSDEFHIDDQPTYPGREFEGHKVQGLMFNVRAVQATFDDANPETRKNWVYPDTGVWDPDRNTREFCAALADWRNHGILAFTINCQGGGPLYVPEIYQNYDNNGFTPEGELRPDYAQRIARVLERADELGMVAIVGIFYWIFLRRMEGEAGPDQYRIMRRAAHSALEFLESTGRENILVEIANEIEVVVKFTGMDLFSYEGQAEMVAELKRAHPGLPISTSHMASSVDPENGIPADSLIEAVDYVLIHGNGTRAEELSSKIQSLKAMPVYQANRKPVLINEDSPAVPNMEAAWTNYVSWGYYDQGWAGQGPDPYEWYAPLPRWVDRPFDELTGFQTPPVNWSINSPFKKAFFGRVKEITGA